VCCCCRCPPSCCPCCLQPRSVTAWAKSACRTPRQAPWPAARAGSGWSIALVLAAAPRRCLSALPVQIDAAAPNLNCQSLSLPCPFRLGCLQSEVELEEAAVGPW
jgi:hypothetical protein